jgi:hypothetical protein
MTHPSTLPPAAVPESPATDEGTHLLLLEVSDDENEDAR